MTDILDDSSRKALIEYRINRAEETLGEVETLIKEQYYNTAINRIYYACFYSLTALMVKSHLNAQTHAGVKQMFGLHFVLTGKVDKSLSLFYNALFDERQSSDYEDFVYFDEETALKRYNQAKGFISTIEKLVLDEI
ncbi:HEPN domain-containing protein [Parabacteroides sp. PF5-6]|uniref:HEPN domain-containing protein n=1 Tax=Parabacteroides sp. PF5-6 TaxID=1742403 RepID=UPI0024050648|nr:HEPN domain-containing protein [Parabacteroides sp. PF5-6]MDF9831227.1 uncharacterized protein (UPF0332 family) [Parabacteroides sp. PF5-6]